MNEEQIAVLSIQMHTHDDRNDYTFLLRVPGQLHSISGPLTSIPTKSQQDLVHAIEKAAEHLNSRQGLVDLEKLGQFIYTRFLPKDIRNGLSVLALPLVIEANNTTDIPWELCHDGRDFLAVRLAMTRMPYRPQRSYAAAQSAKHKAPTCLIIAPTESKDKTKTLKAARAEALALNKFFTEMNLNPVCLLDDDATYMKVNEELNKNYSIIHICGHAEFNRDTYASIVLAEDRELTIDDIQKSLCGSPLVFVNACESGRTETSPKQPVLPTYSAMTMGLPFAFMSAEKGSACAFIGSPWRIEDVDAGAFSLAFYKALLASQTIGDAMKSARVQTKKKSRSATWAYFVLYGEPNLRLFGQAVAPSAPRKKLLKKEKKTQQVVVLPLPTSPPSPAAAPIPPVLEDGRLNRARLGDSAQQVIHHAELETVLTGAKFMTTCQFFIGLTKIESGKTQAALCRQGVNPEEIRDVLRNFAVAQAEVTRVLTGADDGEADKKDEGIGFSNSVTEILRRADRIAREENRQGALVEEHHLLLGFVSQGGGTARDALENWGVGLDALEACARGQPISMARHPLFDDEGCLRSDLVAPDLAQTLHEAWQEAHQGAVRYLATPYFVEALLQQGSLMREALRAQKIDPAVIQKAIHASLSTGRPRHQDRAELYLYDLSRRVQNILRIAHDEAHARGVRVITEPYIVLGFVRDEGGATRKALETAGVDFVALEKFVRQMLPPARKLAPLFLPDGRVNLQTFDTTGHRVLESAKEEALSIGMAGVDTRRLVLGLAGFSSGSFARALARQDWDADHLRRYFYRGLGRLPELRIQGRLELTRRNLSRGVVAILEQAWKTAGTAGITERHIALSFLDSGGRWKGGEISELGLNIAQLRADVAKKSVGDQPNARRDKQPPPDSKDQGKGTPKGEGPDPLFDADGRLNLGTLTPAARRALKDACAIAKQRNAEQIDVQHLVLAFLESGDEGLFPAALAQQGLTFDQVRSQLQGLEQPSGTQLVELENKFLTAGLLQLLSHAHGTARAESAELVDERHLLMGLVTLTENPPVLALTKAGVDLAQIRQTLVRHPLFGTDGRLLRSRLSLTSQQILDHAAREALLNGNRYVGTPHLFMALVSVTDGMVERALRRQGFSAAEMRDAAHAVLRGEQPRPQGQIQFVQTALSPMALNILQLAEQVARVEGAGCVEEKHLALGFMRGVDGALRIALEQRGVNLTRLENDILEESSAPPAMEEHASVVTATQPPVEDMEKGDLHDLFLPNGNLNRSLFDKRAVRVLDEAVKAARRLNHQVVGTPHLFLGLLSLPSGLASTMLQQQGLQAETVRRTMLQVFPPAQIEMDGLQAELVRDLCSANLTAILQLARTWAKANGTGWIGERELLVAFMQDGGGNAGAVLEKLGLRRRHVLLSLGERVETPTLDKLGNDLTREAREGKLNPVFGRDREIKEVIEAMAMKVKNAPLLVGEAGVGKTAIVEGLAQRIASGTVPEHLRDKRIIQIQVGELVAGTIYRGQFEERVQRLLEEAKQPDIILFIDEIHTLVGAGLAEGATLDAGNMFKPALARGDVQVIGATTPREASLTIEKDTALERRFYRIDVREPNREETLAILQQIRLGRAEYYKVTIRDDALAAAVDLSIQHVPERHLPDKAIEALDRACAKAAVSQQDNKVVSAAAVAAAIAEWKDIPIEQLTAAQQQQLLQLKEALRKRIIGQDEAIEAVVHSIWRSRTGLKDLLRPVGVMLFIGPTGVGKTELALVLADELYRSRDAVIRVDMSEFQEAHNITKLIGAPPGYIGYHDEGQLTGPLRRRPSSIVLLDEVDKVQANSGVLDLFLQLFDHGQIKDGQGRLVDGRNAFFIMTANVAPDLVERRTQLGFVSNQQEEAKGFREQVQSRLRKDFRPEFLNRIDEIIVFRRLDREDGRAIVKLNLQRLQAQLMEQKGIELGWDQTVEDFLLDKDFSPTYGARALQRGIKDWIEKPLSEEMLRGQTGSVSLSVSDNHIVFKWSQVLTT